MMRDYVTTALKKVAPAIPFSITIPEHAEHGDYATNAAFIIGKKEEKSPKEIAEGLIKKLDQEPFEKIKIAGNGFINFFLKKEILYKELAEILKEKKAYGKGAPKKEKINVEFVSANPTGPLTMANGRGGFYGDVLSNILGVYGYKVTREYYVNDAGNQIYLLGNSIWTLRIGKTLGEQHYKGRYISELAQDKRLMKYKVIDRIGMAATKILREEIAKSLENADIRFENWFFETKDLRETGEVKETLKKFEDKNLLETKDEAIWYDGRVLIKSNGDPTYLLVDIAYQRNKLIKRNFDLAITILGADHHAEAMEVLKGIEALGIPRKKLKILIIQLVRLVQNGKEIRMGKRTGSYVTLDELLGEVGLDAARYFFLEKSPDTHMDFDIGLAKEQSNKNPVYYIQYAHARISSILRNIDKNHELGIMNYGLLKEKEELTLIKKMGEFPEIIKDTAKDYHVHRIPRYAYELAQTFHNFYEKHRVITDDENLTHARLSLVAATQIILQNTLQILGISTPEQM